MTEFTITDDFPKSQVEFDARFNSEEACQDYLFNMKWPDGFECRKCEHKEYWVSARGLYICTRCEISHSLTSGTAMHGTQKPLSYWFKAMWWFTSRKSGVNAVNLQDLLGFSSYQTAWTWFHKLRRCTIRQGRERLSGRVEVDEFYIGGQKPGKRGRGSSGKTIVVAAVEKDGRGFGRIRLQVIPDCSSPVLQAFINKNIAPDSTIVTDGWKGYHPIDSEKYTHEQQVSKHIEDKDSVLPGVHRIASLVKRLMLSTFQGRFGPSHLQSYLDEYVFRFNRRKSRYIGKKFMRIVQQVVVSPGTSYRKIIGGISPYHLLAN